MTDRLRKYLAAIASIAAICVAFALVFKEPLAAATAETFRAVNAYAANVVATTSLKVASGTEVTNLHFGSLSVGASATTGTLTLSGVTSSDKVIATIQSGNSSGVFIKTAVPGTDSIDITLSGTPGATTVVSALAIK